MSDRYRMYKKMKYCKHAKERKRNESLWIRCMCDARDRRGVVDCFNNFLNSKNDR